MQKRFLISLPGVAFVLMLALAAPVWAQGTAPELSISKEGPAEAEPGQGFIYTIVVRNTGNAEATEVVVRDRLPQGVRLQSAPPDCTSGPTVTCNIGTLAADASRRIELTVRAPDDAREIENRATVDSAQTDPANSNTVTTTVAPRLVIRKLDDPDPVGTEELLLYTLRVQNEGNNFVTNVGVTDDLPLDVVDFVTIDSRDFDCQFTAGAVQCSGGALGPGEIAKVEVVVEPERAGTISNSAAVFFGRTRIDTDSETTSVVSGETGDNRDGGGGNQGGGNGGGNQGGGNQGGGNQGGGNQGGGNADDNQYADDGGDDDIINIPDKPLPDTGGPPLPAAAAVLLLLAGAALAARLFRA